MKCIGATNSRLGLSYNLGSTIRWCTCLSGYTVMMRRALPIAVAAGMPSPSHAHRQVTTRGQFNPIHDFSVSTSEPQRRAATSKEFERMITNPGPLRVGYSPDYLDWLYKAYKSKIQYEDARAKVGKVFKGMLLSDQDRGRSASATAHDRLPGAAPPGQVIRPPQSLRRQAGEAKRVRAQRTLDTVSKRQGLLDLFERQPQFPVIHIGKATRFHIVELFKDMVLDRALAPEEIWDKALMYRAILVERRQSYPDSFKYIFSDVEAAVFAPSTVVSEQEKEGLTAKPHPLASRCPTLDDYNYFLFLVKRYYVDNAVEGHVVLRCHRSDNMAHLLFSNPPPKDVAEVQSAIFEGSAKKSADDVDHGRAPPTTRPSSAPLQAPTAYPPIEALWRCEENLPLLRLLVFGELNLMVSENPFVKYPNAQGYLTRPQAVEGQLLDAMSTTTSPSQQQHQRGSRRDRDTESISLAKLIEEKRGHLLAPLPRMLSASLDGRANDLRRLQQRYHREDTIGFQKMMKATEASEDPANYAAFSDWSYFNPRAVRAETRDQLQRQGVEALKQYDGASQDIYRFGFETVEIASMTRPTEQMNTMPTYVPTLPHFLAAIKKDAHISYLTHVGLPELTGKREELDRLMLQLAGCLHKTAMEYFKESLRRVHRQRVNVAATLLDNFVRAEWLTMIESSNSDIRSAARRLGDIKAFETRMWDESGFTSDARVDDYERWMEAPKV